MVQHKKLFGTDGIRGTANFEYMNADTALKLGMAAGSLFINGSHRHRVIIGKDTRLSGYLFESALTAGFISVGMDVLLVGPMPTPAIAMLTKSMRADLGVMISASHNAYQDNGIKLFGPDGQKLSDAQEFAIEERIFGKQLKNLLSTPDHVGKAKRIDDASGRYIEFIKASFPKGKNLDNLKIVIDCANGAAYHIGPTIFWELGAEVVAICVNPDGSNINHNCGSTNPKYLAEQVLLHKADIGIALDGDADRLTIVDELGNIVPGEKLMGTLALYLKEKNCLQNNTLVTTILSNLALEKFLNNHNINTVRTNVGDRHIVSSMRANKYNFGGEESGHVIFGDYATTGDGLLVALQLLALQKEKNQPISKLCNLFELLPQCKKTFKLNSEQTNILENEHVKIFIAKKHAELENIGRLVIRKSGTEPIIRVMAEGSDIKLLNKIVDEIIAELGKH